MFSGIVERLCRVVSVRREDRSPDTSASTAAARLDVELGDLLEGLHPGASVAVNGACLTLTEQSGSVGSFHVIPETWQATTLQELRPGDEVNVERSLQVGDRIDGHFVQGHVDGIGTIDRIQREGGEHKIWVRADAGLMPYIIRKGSVALDGTSLTVVDVDGDGFSVALIPTTLERTVLGRRGTGQRVNIETDILARLVVSRLEALAGGGAAPRLDGGLTVERLQESGFLP